MVSATGFSGSKVIKNAPATRFGGTRAPKKPTDSYLAQQSEADLDRLKRSTLLESEHEQMRTLMSTVVHQHGEDTITGFDLLRTFKKAVRRNYRTSFFNWISGGVGLTGILSSLKLTAMDAEASTVMLLIAGLASLVSVAINRDTTAENQVKVLDLKYTYSSTEMKTLIKNIHDMQAKMAQMHLLKWPSDDEFRLSKKGREALAWYEAEAEELMAFPEYAHVPAAEKTVTAFENPADARRQFEAQIAQLQSQRTGHQQTLDEIIATTRKESSNLELQLNVRKALGEKVDESKDPEQTANLRKFLIHMDTELAAQQGLVDAYQLHQSVAEEKIKNLVEGIDDAISRVRVAMTRTETLDVRARTAAMARSLIESAESVSQAAQMNPQLDAMLSQTAVLHDTLNQMLEATEIDQRLSAMKAVREKLVEIESLRDIKNPVAAFLEKRAAENHNEENARIEITTGQVISV